MSAIATDDEIRLAWCAGIFDGQGSVGIYASHGKPRVTIRMTITTLAALKAAQDAAGAGHVYQSTARPPRQQQWTWAVTNQSDCARVLQLLLPFLIVKKRDAEVALAFLAGALSAPAAQELLQARRTRRGPRPQNESSTAPDLAPGHA